MKFEGHNGYKVIANYCDRIAICYNPEGHEQFVVWFIDADGIPYCGMYTASINAARHEFCGRIITGCSRDVDCVLEDICAAD